MATEAGVTGTAGAPLAPGEKLYFGLAGSNTVGNKAVDPVSSSPRRRSSSSTT